MRRRNGIALLAALAVMALVALLVVGGFASSTLAQRASRLSHTDALLTAAADYAVNSVLAESRAYALADLPFGVPRLLGIPIQDDAGIIAEVAVTRLRGGMLWLVGDATLSGSDQGHRRINIVARFPIVGALPGAAIVSRGPVSIGRNVSLPADSDTEPGCSVANLTDVLLAPGVELSGGDGARVGHGGGASDSGTYYLAGRQTAALSRAGNVVRVHGDTTIAGGSFDGILIVDGALTIAGPFAATGLVITQGRFDARAGGLVLTGALLSFAVPADGAPAIQISDATVRYSGCAIEHALRTAIPPHPVRQRSWSELF